MDATIIYKLKLPIQIIQKVMEKEKPDNIVFSKENGYNASRLPYATNVGAPVLKIDDVVSLKSRGIHSVNK
ncbi:hypothetical protein [Flavobacterium cellulosilyticum]|uniref:hypothetical protein n=1 Tax=Flavobacterium cellulosilyticum TaxID=2541731 RepID=UPI001FE8DE0A|nr:hypothetical protein [Flavobacterium cellulosilyticum]